MHFGNMEKSNNDPNYLFSFISKYLMLFLLLCRTPYLALAKTFEAIEAISSRLRMIEVLANFFRSVILLNPSDLIACVYLSLNQLAPAYEGNNYCVKDENILSAICVELLIFLLLSFTKTNKAWNWVLPRHH